MNLDQHLRDIITCTIGILFPMAEVPQTLIVPHKWWDRRYVGEKEGQPVAWKGLRANLNKLDFRYRTLYVDVVDNVLPYTERLRLFGADFTEATASYSQFVVMFVLDFPHSAIDAIKDQGFIPRQMTRVVHACSIAGVDEFLSQSAWHWAGQLARLVMLQRVLSIHRKPLDANEVPLQNLLYRTGYFHQYLVTGGLELLDLSEPRGTGEFGHDLHARVRNPTHEPEASFAIGIELYTGPIGYHVQTIPEYVKAFGLQGMIVVSKDDPMPALQAAATNFARPIQPVYKVSDMMPHDTVAIHHLALEQVVVDMTHIQDELALLLPGDDEANLATISST